MEVISTSKKHITVELGFDRPTRLVLGALQTPVEGILLISDGRFSRSCFIRDRLIASKVNTHSPWAVGIGDDTVLIMGSALEIHEVPCGAVEIYGKEFNRDELVGLT